MQIRFSAQPTTPAFGAPAKPSAPAQTLTTTLPDQFSIRFGNQSFEDALHQILEAKSIEDKARFVDILKNTHLKNTQPESQEDPAKEAAKSHRKMIMASFGIGLASLAGCFGLALPNMGSKYTTLDSVMPQVLLEQPTNPRLTPAGNKALASGWVNVKLNDSDFKEMDEFFSTVVVEMAKESGVKVSDADVLRRVELLQEKAPQIVELYLQLNQDGDISDPEKVFFGLLNILGEDMPPEQRERFESQALEYFDDYSESLTFPQVLGAVFIPILAALSVMTLTTGVYEWSAYRKEIKRIRNRNTDDRSI